jgi:hypothetical protein
VVADWIIEENLRPFLTALGWFVGYDFDEDDWTAIRYGIKGTEQDADRWFDYEFAGQHRAYLWLASDTGTSILHVRVEVPESVVPKVEAALSIFQWFHLAG